MSNILRKNFNQCFFGLHNPSQPHAPPPQTSSLLKTFSTIYDLTSESTSKSFTFSSSSEFMISSSDDSSDTDQSNPPDFATVFASQRFFFASPGQSNSIIESSPEYVPSSQPLSGGVAVPTYSPDPVADFRRSMQEMIEARHCDNYNDNGNGTSDFQYLHELLSCYIRLNSEENHKYVITAFTEIILGLISDRRKPPQSRRRLVL